MRTLLRFLLLFLVVFWLGQGTLKIAEDMGCMLSPFGRLLAIVLSGFTLLFWPGAIYRMLSVKSEDKGRKE